MKNPARNLLRSRANLRVQRRVQQTNQATLPHRKTPESLILQERSPKILTCWQTFQWKYDIDQHTAWWKKLFFHWIYIPFVRFAWHKMGIVLPEAIIPPNANLPNGALLVKNWQGAFSERWMAEQEASRHLHGGYTEVDFNCSETSATIIEPRSICVASPVDLKVRDTRNWDEAAALRRLQETLVRSRYQVEAFKSLRT